MLKNFVKKYPKTEEAKKNEGQKNEVETVGLSEVRDIGKANL